MIHAAEDQCPVEREWQKLTSNGGENVGHGYYAGRVMAGAAKMSGGGGGHELFGPVWPSDPACAIDLLTDAMGTS